MKTDLCGSCIKENVCIYHDQGCLCGNCGDEYVADFNVLEQIKEEIRQTANDYDKFCDYRRNRGLWIALDIIEKYTKGE